MLGILNASENVCHRATFIVDPEGVIQYANCHNEAVGRSVEEILRVLDALQSNELALQLEGRRGDFNAVNAHTCARFLLDKRIRARAFSGMPFPNYLFLFMAPSSQAVAIGNVFVKGRFNAPRPLAYEESSTI